MPTYQSVMQEAVKRLQEAHVDNPVLDARLLLQHSLNMLHEDVIKNSNNNILDGEVEKYYEVLSRRVKREPLSHITGERDFWKHTFKVTPDVLDPRPDSETLIEAVLAHIDHRAKPMHILDLGTGSGCLLLSLLAELPKAMGLGIDSSDAALKVAKENAALLSLDSQVSWKRSHWFEGVNQQFDIIISNPPYIPTSDIEALEPEVKQYEPYQALDGGEDGLDDIRHIVSHAKDYLAEGGLLAMEIGYDQSNAVAALCKDAGFASVNLHKDLAGIERVVVAS